MLPCKRHLYNRHPLTDEDEDDDDDEKRPPGASRIPNAPRGFHDGNYFTHFRGRFLPDCYTGPYILTVTTILNDRINFYGAIVK